MTRIRWGLLVLLLLLAGSAAARTLLQEERCIVPADEVVQGPLFVFCQEVRIDGVVQGDVIGAAVRASLAGEVQGAVYLLAGQVDVRGTVRDDVHFAGAALRISPPADGDPLPPPTLHGGIKALAFSTVVYEEATVHEPILGAGYQLVLHGTVEDEVNYLGSALHIEGRVAGDVYATVGDPNTDSTTLQALLLPLDFDIAVHDPGFVLTEGGHIGGDLEYGGPAAGDIRGSVGGISRYEAPFVLPIPNLEEPEGISGYVAQVWREFSTLVAFGLLLLVLLPKPLQHPLRAVSQRSLNKLGLGALVFLLSLPVLLVLLLLSALLLLALQRLGLAGLVLALATLLGSGLVGGAGLFYFVALVPGRALVGMAVGRVLLQPALRGTPAARWQDVLALLVGLLLLVLLVSLPLVGWLLNLAAVFLGLGALVSVLLKQLRRIRVAVIEANGMWGMASPLRMKPRPVMLPHSEPQAPVIAPPDMSHPPGSPPPGMGNLPEGFDFSFFEDDEE